MSTQLLRESEGKGERTGKGTAEEAAAGDGCWGSEEPGSQRGGMASDRGAGAGIP